MRSSWKSISFLRQSLTPWQRTAVATPCLGSRIISTSSRNQVHNYNEKQRAGHPPDSFHLRYTDPLPNQEHGRDVRLKLPLEKPELQGPRIDKLYKTIELEILSYEPATVDSYEWFVVAAATHLGITLGKRWAPEKPDNFRFNLLRSVFVHKKHQVHYEVRTYHRFINLHKLTGSTADTFLEYIERNLPEGIGLKVTKFEVIKVPEYISREVEDETKDETPVSIESGK